mmetsp:Transcript_10121/g.24923  ORF Transcript_10121/g.24923 Transcript_10121/m.24923 type:complete len:113 (+) Transcript_10121:572-910(+)
MAGGICMDMSTNLNRGDLLEIKMSGLLGARSPGSLKLLSSGLQLPENAWQMVNVQRKSFGLRIVSFLITELSRGMLYEHKKLVFELSSRSVACQLTNICGLEMCVMRTENNR